MNPTPDIFAALSSETRIRLLEALRDKSLQCTDPDNCTLSDRCCNVGELAEKLELTQPTVSHHLKELRRAGLIETQKEGRSVYCTINDETFEQLNTFLKTFYSNRREGTCN